MNDQPAGATEPGDDLAPPGLPGRPAPMGRRSIARLIDVFAVLSILLLSYVVGARLALRAADANGGELGPDGEARLVTGIAIGVLLVIAYEVVPTAFAGATLGKRVMGLRVVRVTDGGRPGLGRAVLRWMPPSLGGLVCGLGTVVYLSALLDSSPLRQGWHDMLARTAVVLRPRKRPPARKPLEVSPRRPTR